MREKGFRRKTLRNALAATVFRTQLEGGGVRAGSGSELGGRSAVLPTPISRVCPAGLRALRFLPGSAHGPRDTRTARAVPGGLNLSHTATLSPSGAFALGLWLSSVVFHLPEKHSATSFDGGEVMCLLQVRHCQLRAQARSRSSQMGL